MKTLAISVLHYIALAICMFLVAVYVYGFANPDIPNNSDMIQPFLVMRDFFIDPFSLRDWYHSPSLYVVPDWIASGVIQALPVSRWLMPLIYSGALLAGYSLTAGYIYSASYLTSPARGSVYAASIITVLFLAAMHAVGNLTASMTFYLGVQYIHTGAIVIGLALIAILLNDRRGASPTLSRQLFAAALLSAVGGYSDSIIVFWFAVPIAVALLAGAIVTRRSPRMIIPAVILFSSLAGVLIDRSTRAFPTEVLRNYDQSFATIKTILRNSLHGDWPLIPILMLCAAMLIRSAFILLRSSKTQELGNADAAELILTAVSWASLLLPLATGSLIAPTFLRYSLPMMLLPYLWAGIVLLRFLPRLPSYLAALAIAVGAGIVIPKTGAALDSNRLLRSSLYQCLDNHGLNQGYSDYWMTKTALWSTDYRIHLIPLDSNGWPKRFNTREKWFRHHAGDGRPLSPNFILTSRLDEAKLRERTGRGPDEVINCGADRVWVYRGGIDLIGP